MTNLIRGKVARILNAREIAINVGSAHGVSTDMYFDVMDKNFEDIEDPDTSEILGSIPRPKVRVRVTKVEEKLSLATTYRTKQRNVGGGGISADIIARAFAPSRFITTTETLKKSEKPWEDLKEEESFVKTGDPVVQVILVEEEEPA